MEISAIRIAGVAGGLASSLWEGGNAVGAACIPVPYREVARPSSAFAVQLPIRRSAHPAGAGVLVLIPRCLAEQDGHAAEAGEAGDDEGDGHERDEVAEGVVDVAREQREEEDAYADGVADLAVEREDGLGPAGDGDIRGHAGIGAAGDNADVRDAGGDELLGGLRRAASAFAKEVDGRAGLGLQGVGGFARIEGVERGELRAGDVAFGEFGGRADIEHGEGCAFGEESGEFGGGDGGGCGAHGS